MHPVSSNSQLPPVVPVAQETPKVEEEIPMVIDQDVQRKRTRSEDKGEAEGSSPPLKERKIEPLPEKENELEEFLGRPLVKAEKLNELPTDMLLKIGDYLGVRDLANISAVSPYFAKVFSFQRGVSLSRFIATQIFAVNAQWLETQKNIRDLPHYTAVIREGLAFMKENETLPSETFPRGEVFHTVDQRSKAVTKLLEQKELKFATGESVGQAVEALLALGPIRLVAKCDALWKMRLAKRSSGLDPRASHVMNELICHQSYRNVSEQDLKTALDTVHQHLANFTLEGRLDFILSLLMEGPILNPLTRMGIIKGALALGHFDMMQAMLENRPIDHFAQAVREQGPIDNFTIGRNLVELVTQALALLKPGPIVQDGIIVLENHPFALRENDRGGLLNEGVLRLDIGVMRAALNDGPIALEEKLDVLQDIVDIGFVDMMQLIFDHLPEGAPEQPLRDRLAIRAAENGYPEIVAAIRARGPLSDAAQEELNKIAAIEAALLNHQDLPETPIRRRIIMAARCGNFEKFKDILLGDEPLAPEGIRGQRPPDQFVIDILIIVAARHGRLDVLKKIFEVYYVASGPARALALGAAKQAGHWDIVKLLIRNNGIWSSHETAMRNFAIEDAIREDIQNGSIHGLAEHRRYNPYDSGFNLMRRN